jgi:hypothetical protein
MKTLKKTRDPSARRQKLGPGWHDLVQRSKELEGLRLKLHPLNRAGAFEFSLEGNIESLWRPLVELAREQSRLITELVEEATSGTDGRDGTDAIRITVHWFFAIKSLQPELDESAIFREVEARSGIDQETVRNRIKRGKKKHKAIRDSARSIAESGRLDGIFASSADGFLVQCLVGNQNELVRLSVNDPLVEVMLRRVEEDSAEVAQAYREQVELAQSGVRHYLANGADY